MNLEEKIAQYKSLGIEIEDLELRRKALSQSILSEMTAPKIDVAGYRLKRNTRLFISTPLEQARLFDATKMEETIDKDKLKAIYQSGVAIEGVKETTYLSITTLRDATS